MSDDDGRDGGAVKRVRTVTPREKQRGAVRLLERALTAAKEHTGRDRVVGVFAILVTEGQAAEFAYALTADELAIVKREARPALESAVGTVFGTAHRRPS
jgi:hypothetical protein